MDDVLPIASAYKVSFCFRIHKTINLAKQKLTFVYEQFLMPAISKKNINLDFRNT